MLSLKPACVIMIRERITDPGELAIYKEMAPKARTPELKAIAFYGRSEALEGEPADGIVVLEFPTMEAAKAWHGSPAYQEAMRHRQKGADYRVLLVEGV